VRWLAIISIALGLAFVLASRVAFADPMLPRVLTTPTAWLPGAGDAYGTAGLDRRGDSSLEVGYGLGGLASVELGTDTDIRACATPPCGTDHLATARWLPHAAFRIGVHQDAWVPGQPAMVLGVERTIGHSQAVTQAYVVASRTLGPIKIHGGVAAFDARGRGARLGATVRPVAGFELTPPQYPKTTLVADVAWVPRLDAAPVAEWVFGWGVRYQALHWGSIELAVRHREAEDLGATTVLVRVNGVWRR
jgi:hypothetical protein